MSIRRVYLGKFDRFERRGDLKVAQLLPLCESSDDQQSWERIIDASIHTQEFRNRGEVSWLDPPDSLSEGSLWIFEITEQPFDPKNEWHDAFKVSGMPKGPKEILDLRDFGREEQARLLATVEGIPLSFSPAGQVYLWVDDGTWIGPVHLAKRAQEDVWTISQEESDTLLKSYQPCSENQWKTLVLDVARTFLGPKSMPRRKLGEVDWRPDEAVLKTVLNLLPKLDSSYAHSLGHSRRAVDQLVAVLATAQTSNVELRSYQLQRVREMVHSLEDLHRFANDIVYALRIVSPIKDGLEQDRQRIWEEAREEARGRVQSEIAAETERLEALRRNIAEQHEVRASLVQTIEALQAERESMVDRLDETLTHRLEAILAKPEEMLAEVSLLRAASDLLGNRVAAGRASIKSSVTNRRHPLTGTIMDKGREPAILITKVEELCPLLTKALLAHDVSRRVARPLHATFLAGGIPVFTGSRAFEALTAYASCVTGGQIHWLPVPATILEPVDLLGRLEPATQRFIPHASGLVDLLLHSLKTEELHLVVLEGLNRAAIDAYLLPLLACYADAWRENGARTLSLFAPGAVTDDDPYAAAFCLRWSPNVLLAGIVNEGMVTLSMPKALWSYATLIQCNFLEDDEEPVASGEQHPDQRDTIVAAFPPHTVPRAAWAEWRKLCWEKSLTDCIHLWSKAAQKFDLERGARDRCLRIFAASQLWTDTRRALGDVIAYCLVPQTANQDGTIEDLCDGALLPYRDMREARRLAARWIG